MPSPSRIDVIHAIERERAIAVIRLESVAPLRRVVEALATGGVRAVEITMTMPGALDALAALTSELDAPILVGAGSVLDPETARLAIMAGARFVIAPVFCPRVVRMCHRYDVVAIPGAYTPTEILEAWEAGSDVVKVFPAGGLGAQYLRDLRGPLPSLRLMPSGGVTVENADEFLSAGAIAVGVGGGLIERDAVARADYGRISDQARRLANAIGDARARAR